MMRAAKPVMLIALAATALWPAVPARAADRPNILWLTCEDMSPDLGCYGDTYATTPAIDAFAARSVRYTRAFAEAPVCAPSRSTLITGMHTGPLGTSHMRSSHPVPTAFRGFPAWLRDAGYYTTNNVKTDYNLDAPRFTEIAWDESSGTAHWRKRPPGKPFFSVFNCVDSHQGPSSRDAYDLFVKKVQSRLEPGEIHDPAQAPLPPYYPDSPIARRTVARAYDCITAVDGFVRDKLAELEADGLADDTIVFFFSDHGAGMPGGKAAAFARGLRVPLLVHFPEKFRHLAPAANGTVTDRLVSFVDFGPTVLNLAGVPVPTHMQGKPFLGADLPEPAPFVHGVRDRHDETLETTRWISDGRYHLVRSYDTRRPADQQTLLSFYNGNGELCREIRALKAAGKLTAVQRHLWGDSRPPLMLFDIEADPWCIHDLAGDPAHADRVKAMLATLESGMLRDLDLGFWPEPDRVAAEQGHSAHLRARQGGRYPLDRILPVARLVGQGPQHRPAFVAALADPDASVRYWAAVGLAALGDDPAPLRPLVADASPAVRIVAAEALVRQADDPAGLDLLVVELDSRNEWAATRAARSLELLGEKARPKLDAMRDALRRRSAGFLVGEEGPDPVNYGLEFALTTAIEALDAGMRSNEPAAPDSAAGTAAPARLRVYHIGNSLTRNIPLARLRALFASAGTTYDYGQQLGPGFRLEMHLVNAAPGTPIAKIDRYNLVEPYSQYSDAFRKFTFDAVVLQPFQMPLDLDEKIDTPPFFTVGDLQAASGFIDYARGRTKPGTGRWDLEHPNTDHVACQRFFIYATWPPAQEILAHAPPTFAAYYAQPYPGGKVSCADFYAQLVDRLNERYPDLPTPVRMIPAGAALAALDERIRAGTLPGIEAFYARNQAYFVRARRNDGKPSPFDPDAFDPQAGVLNVYADGIHLNDQPHNGDDSGTIGSYVAALTTYATLAGKSPVGLTAEPYEQFDPRADAALVRALQETVWQVVSTHRHAGVAAAGDVRPQPPENSPEDVAFVSRTQSKPLDVFIASDGRDPADRPMGIYHATLDAATGTLSPPTLAAEVQHPAFLAVSPNGRFLFSARLVDREPEVVSFAIRDDARLECLGGRPSEGLVPCHLQTDRTGSTLFVANFRGGTVAALAIDPTGTLAASRSVHRHTGSSVLPRQEGPHPHSIYPGPDNRHVYVPDLGLDRVVIYRFDPADSTLARAGEAALPPGSGPRHMAFSADGRHAFVVNEMALTVGAFAIRPDGMLEPKAVVSTVAEGERPDGTSASEIRVHPSGRFVYAANRGADSIAVFRLAEGPENDRPPERIQVADALVRVPRSFQIDPTGRWLLACGQRSHDVAILAIDPDTGTLTSAGRKVAVPSPMSIEFVPCPGDVP